MLSAASRWAFSSPWATLYMQESLSRRPDILSFVFHFTYVRVRILLLETSWIIERVSVKDLPGKPTSEPAGRQAARCKHQHRMNNAYSAFFFAGRLIHLPQTRGPIKIISSTGIQSMVRIVRRLRPVCGLHVGRCKRSASGRCSEKIHGRPAGHRGWLIWAYVGQS